MIELSLQRQTPSLGTFLRAMRERQAPDAHGIVGTHRRRTPGLRREEVAQLCGLSATWYTWIEQDRGVTVSPSTLAGLAHGLRLSRAERSYMFELAGKRDPGHEPVADDPPNAVLASVDAIDGPAYFLNRVWTACRWNAKASRLFVGWLDAGGEPNLLRYLFLRPEARSLIDDWENRAARVVAEFRAATTNDINDPVLAGLVAELIVQSPDFARCWAAHGVLAREGGMRTFRHPMHGELKYQQVSLSLAGWPDFRLTMLIEAQRARTCHERLSVRS